MIARGFADNSVFITGAGAGIGRATALAFARSGAGIAIVDLVEDHALETARLVEAEGARGVAIVADVSDVQSVSVAFRKAVDAFGRVDHAINNAGINQSPMLTSDIPPELWLRIMAVNVTGTWLCMREELNHMSTRGGGTIVNIASFGGLRTLPMQSAYVTSKHAVIGLTKNAAVEYAARGVRINSVAPGAVGTAMLYDGVADLAGEERSERLAQVAALHPMNRYGTPEDIADSVLFLCSREAGFVTGACLSVDGGWSIA